MTIAPCRALARFRHREKIAARKSLPAAHVCRDYPPATISLNGGPARSLHLPYRSECGCACHRPPYALHIVPCCRPDPPARVKQTSLSRETGEVVTRMWDQDIGGLPHLCVELRRADAPSDAEQQWAKAVVAMHTHMMQDLAATGRASVFIPSKPDARRGPENYWWDHATGASGRERE